VAVVVFQLVSSLCLISLLLYNVDDTTDAAHARGLNLTSPFPDLLSPLFVPPYGVFPARFLWVGARGSRRAHAGV
jgi:hypothetical protein